MMHPINVPAIERKIVRLGEEGRRKKIVERMRAWNEQWEGYKWM